MEFLKSKTEMIVIGLILLCIGVAIYLGTKKKKTEASVPAADKVTDYAVISGLNGNATIV
jgi:uncharacterized membrane protein